MPRFHPNLTDKLHFEREQLKPQHEYNVITPKFEEYTIVANLS